MPSPLFIASVFFCARRMQSEMRASIGEPTQGRPGESARTSARTRMGGLRAAGTAAECRHAHLQLLDVGRDGRRLRTEDRGPWMQPLRDLPPKSQPRTVARDERFFSKRLRLLRLRNDLVRGINGKQGARTPDIPIDKTRHDIQRHTRIQTEDGTIHCRRAQVKCVLCAAKPYAITRC